MKHFREKYPRALQNEYVFLARKFRLKPIESHLWKFLRLRPSNFPTLRIAQFAALLHRSHLLSKVLETETIEGLMDLLEVEASEYWTTHYRFDKRSTPRKKALGRSAAEIIIINTIAPFLFVYGKERGEERFCSRSLSLLEKLAPESNVIVTGWKKLGINARSAYDSQALLQLKNEYCARKKCLSCQVGNALLK